MSCGVGQKPSKKFFNDVIDPFLRGNSFLSTAFAVGEVLSNAKMNSIWKKIDTYYKKNLKGKEKDSKKIWYCHQLSFRRQGISDGYFKPTGTIQISKKGNQHGKYARIKEYEI